MLAGKISLSWLGTSPRLIIMDPTLIKEVLLNKQGHFHLPPLNPLILILTKGLTTLHGEKWAMHRKIINPAFHLEKLKVSFSTSRMLIFVRFSTSNFKSTVSSVLKTLNVELMKLKSLTGL